MKKANKILCILLVLATCLGCVGCGASIDYIYDFDGEYYYYYMSVNMDAELRYELESTASLRDESVFGRKTWKVEDWLNKVFPLFGYVRYAGDMTPGESSITFLRKVSVDEMEDDDDEDDTDPNRSVERKNLFYFYDNTITMSNPFNSARKDFGECKAGETSIYSIIKYGYKENVQTEFGIVTVDIPSFFEAFPAAEGKNLDLLVLNFFLPADGMTGASGTPVTVGGADYYKFDRLFDTEEYTISYSYLSINPVGWYVTVILAGLIVVGLILLATHRNKREKDEPHPAMTGERPIDPFEGYSGSNADSKGSGGFKY